MLTKSLFAAAALAATLAVAIPAPEAQAKTNFDIDVNLGLPIYGDGYGYGYDNDYGYDYGYGHGYGRDGYYPAHGGYGHYGISCSKGRQIVRWSGFRNVKAVDCDRPGYKYTGWKHGRKFLVRVSGSGSITSVKRVH